MRITDKLQTLKLISSKNRNIHVILDSSLFYLIFPSFFDSMYCKKYALFEINNWIQILCIQYVSYVFHVYMHTRALFETKHSDKSI